MLAEALGALQDHAVLLAPSQATAAPKIGDGSYDVIANMVRFTGPFNATGQPVVSIPTGVSNEGLPLSMQIIGKPFDEAAVLRVADAYERARGPLPLPKI